MQRVVCSSRRGFPPKGFADSLRAPRPAPRSLRLLCTPVSKLKCNHYFCGCVAARLAHTRC